MQHDDQLSKDVSSIKDDVKTLKEDVNTILHGNGREGLWAISDAIFGKKNQPSEPGLMSRVKVVENEARERRWINRGIAIGVGLVGAETLLDVNVLAFLGSLLGR